VQQSESPILHLDLIRDMHKFMREAGFAQTRLIHFPQTIYPSGWWSGSIAQKTAGPLAERLDEAAIAKLDTEFYNAETHRAAFALPNFVKKAISA
jgi:spermidine synthase